MSWRDWYKTPRMAIKAPEPLPNPANAFPAASDDPDWIEAKKFIRTRLVALRRDLETIGLPHDEAQGCRFAILELEGVLNCRNPSKMYSDTTD